MPSEKIDLDTLEGARREAYELARNQRGTHFYLDENGERRKVRYTRPLTSGTTMAGLEDLSSHHMPGYWYDAPADGGPGVRFEDA